MRAPQYGNGSPPPPGVPAPTASGPELSPQQAPQYGDGLQQPPPPPAGFTPPFRQWSGTGWQYMSNPRPYQEQRHPTQNGEVPHWPWKHGDPCQGGQG